jgi:hypothetical protein
MPDLNIFALSRPAFSDGYGVPILAALNRLGPDQKSLLIQKQKPVSFHHGPTKESGFGRPVCGRSLKRVLRQASAVLTQERADNVPAAPKCQRSQEGDNRKLPWAIRH